MGLSSGPNGEKLLGNRRRRQSKEEDELDFRLELLDKT